MSFQGKDQREKGHREYASAIETAAKSLADSVASALPRRNPVLLVKLAILAVLGSTGLG